MTIAFSMLAQSQGQGWSPDPAGSALRGIVSLVVVIGLIGLLAWLLRRGSLGAFGLTPGRVKGPVTVEASVPLGERRSLMIVAVEGRRLLLGLTPGQVSLVTELERPSVVPPREAGRFGSTLDGRMATTSGGVS